MTSQPIDLSWGRSVSLTRANGFGRIRGSRYSWTRQFLSREDRRRRKRKIVAWRKEEDCRLTFPDAEKSPLFFFWNRADQERSQSLASKTSQYSTSECSRRVSFGGNSPNSRQINFSKLIYLRRVIRWLSRLLSHWPALVSGTFVRFASEIVVFTMPSLLRFRTRLWIAITVTTANRYFNMSSCSSACLSTDITVILTKFNLEEQNLCVIIN